MEDPPHFQAPRSPLGIFKKLPPPLRRAVVASLGLFILWLVFLQVVPYAMMHFAPGTIIPAPALQAENSAPQAENLAPQAENSTPQAEIPPMRQTENQPETAPEPPAAESAPKPMPTPSVTPQEAATPEPQPAAPQTATPAQPATSAPETPPEAAAAPAEATPAPANDVALERLHTLETKLDHLAEATERRTESADALQALEQKLQAQEQAIAQLKSAQAANLTALTLAADYDRLKEQLLKGQPYEESLTQLIAHAAGNDAVTKAAEGLRPYAAYGIPRLEFLQTSFDAAVREALLPRAGENAGFWERVKANMARIVSIRRIGAREGTHPEAVIARAEAALAEGNLAGAHRELTGLEEPQSPALQAWLKHAESHLQRDALLAALRAAIFAPAP